ncbi:DUF58 domain-containing protein [bacterium]|nr:DUF58 domain-containing protein [bacterium]
MAEPKVTIRLTWAGVFVLAVALPILGASFVHHVNLLLLLFSLIVAAVFVGTWLGRAQIKHLKVIRSCPTLLPLNRPLTSIMEITNIGKRPAAGVQLTDQTDPDLSPLPTVFVETVGVGETVRARYEWKVPKVGVYRLGPLQLFTSYPFGFVKWSRVLEETVLREPVVVHPPFGKLSVEARQYLGIATLGEGRARSGLLEGIDEFRGVREFRDGDSPKLIHWRSTARRGTLVVRELDPSASRSILMLVYLVEHEGPVEPEIFDNVLAFASTVVAEVCRDPTLQLTIVLVGKEPAIVRGSAASTRAGAYLRIIAAAEPTSAPDALERACRLLRTSDTRDRRLWVVSLAGLPPESQNRLHDSGFRRVSARMVLNASAGDLDRMWIEPTSVPPAPPLPSVDGLEKNGRS